MNQIEAYSKLNDTDGLAMLGNSVFASGMFGCETLEQGQILALQCVVEGKPPLELAKTYHIIQGKLSKRADAMLADFRKAGGKFIFDDLKNPTVQSAKVTFEDYKDFAVEYSIDDAKTAGVYKAAGPWAKVPAAMLRARLVSETLRAIAPEIVTGVYTPEEVSQFDNAPAPAKEQRPAPKKVEADVVEVVIEEPKAPHIDDQITAKIKSSTITERDIDSYFVAKGQIDVDTGSWRDLPAERKQKLCDKFDALANAIGKAKQ